MHSALHQKAMPFVFCMIGPITTQTRISVYIVGTHFYIVNIIQNYICSKTLNMNKLVNAPALAKPFNKSVLLQYRLTSSVARINKASVRHLHIFHDALIH